LIVDDAGTLSEGLQDILPTNIMTSYVDIGDAIQNLNHDRIRIVMFEGDPNSLSLDLGRMKDRDVSAVVISHDPASFPEGFGTAGFFTYRGGTFQSVDTVPYVGRALLLGAVYSDDAVDYQCNIEKARLKLGYTSAILHSKADRLYAEEKLRQCDDTTGVDYANCRDRLLELKGADLDAMHMALQQEIDHCNNELKRRSCPVIY